MAYQDALVPPELLAVRAVNTFLTVLWWFGAWLFIGLLIALALGPFWWDRRPRGH